MKGSQPNDKHFMEQIRSIKTVLVVEDEQDTAEMLQDMLSISGYEALYSCSGQTALSMILNARPDALILDVMLPDISGLEVLQHIRRDPRMESIPVIIVSGNNQPSDIQNCMLAGATAYLTKPVGFWEVKNAIDRCVWGSSKRPTDG
jgi:CheY-like chemotaxis protein